MQNDLRRKHLAYLYCKNLKKINKSWKEIYLSTNWLYQCLNLKLLRITGNIAQNAFKMMLHAPKNVIFALLEYRAPFRSCQSS